MNNFPLWDNSNFEVVTPKNPHVPTEEGLHVVVLPKKEITSAWADPELCGHAFNLAAQVCKIMEELEMAPWFNIQANGNWGLLPGGTLQFHIHIYARLKGKTWGMPVQLPLAPGTYTNDPMSEPLRQKLADALSENLKSL